MTVCVKAFTSILNAIQFETKQIGGFFVCIAKVILISANYYSVNNTIMYNKSSFFLSC